MEQTEPIDPQDSGATEQGFLHLEEAQEETTQKPIVSGPAPDVKPATPLSAQAQERAGTIEHLASRRPLPPLDADTPEIKERLTVLRMEVTRLVTSYRWEGLSVEAAATQMIPLLNVGMVQQWHPILIPFLLEIDRAGNLIPVWLHIIEKGDPSDLPPDANPAETIEGRTRRFAILMLGNYRSGTLLEQDKTKTLFSDWPTQNNEKSATLPAILGELATDPNSSLYATHSLAKLGTTQAIQALVTGLRTAEGWAKVDIIEACLTLNQPRFYDLLVASGLDRVPGLESYVAIPIYRAIPLENYLQSDTNRSPRLTQQAALILSQVLQDSATPPTDGKTLPPAFQRDLTILANVLFENARKTPTWQNVLAIHRLATLLGHYWADISRQAIQDTRIIDPVYGCVPLMPEIERWMAGPGRDILLETLTNDDDQAFTPIVKILGELREPRATSLLITRIESTKELSDREQSRALAAACEALGRLGDRRATLPITQLVNRVIEVERRTSYSRRRDNLPLGDADIPGSVIYASAIHACGLLLGDRNTLDMIFNATRDFDPYVRIQALGALKTLDVHGEDFRSRLAAREALDDPRDTIVRIACQLVLQYRDADANSALRRIIETRSELAAMAYDTLRQLGQ